MGVLDVFRRRTVRAPVNPLDKSTLISILPKEIDEVKHTLQPGRFVIPPGSMVHPALVIIGPSSWWKELEYDQPLLEIPVGSVRVAEAVVNDYCNGLLGCNMNDIMPGLTFLPGEWDESKLRKVEPNLLPALFAKQTKWYESLVQMADILWARSNGNPLAISDDARLAARELNLESGKEWCKDVLTMELVRCKACGSLKNPAYPICSTCKAIDNPALAKELGLQFAS